MRAVTVCLYVVLLRPIARHVSEKTILQLDREEEVNDE